MSTKPTGLSAAMQTIMNRRQKLNTDTVIQITESGGVLPHNHSVTTQTINVVTAVNFAAQTVTLTPITFVTAVQGVS